MEDYTTRIVNYLKRYKVIWEKTNYPKTAVQSCIKCLFAIGIGWMRGEGWILVSIFTCLLDFGIAIVVCVSSKGNLTLKKRCLFEICLVINHILPTSIIMLMLYEMQYGVNIGLVLLYLPVIIIPIIHSLQKDKLFKMGKYGTVIRVYGHMFASTLGSVLIVGMYLLWRSASISKDLPIIMAILCFLFSNVWVSYGFESVLRLYYLRYCDIKGILIDDTSQA